MSGWAAVGTPLPCLKPKEMAQGQAWEDPLPTDCRLRERALPWCLVGPLRGDTGKAGETWGIMAGPDEGVTIGRTRRSQCPACHPKWSDMRCTRRWAPAGTVGAGLPQTPNVLLRKSQGEKTGHQVLSSKEKSTPNSFLGGGSRNFLEPWQSTWPRWPLVWGWRWEVSVSSQGFVDTFNPSPHQHCSSCPSHWKNPDRVLLLPYDVTQPTSFL